MAAQPIASQQIEDEDDGGEWTTVTSKRKKGKGKGDDAVSTHSQQSSNKGSRTGAKAGSRPHNSDEDDGEAHLNFPSTELKTAWKTEQKRLKGLLIRTDDFAFDYSLASGPILIGGVDISFVKGSDTDACSTLVVLSYPSLQVVYEGSTFIQLTQPYVAGFLAFREVEFHLNALTELRNTHPNLVPQVILTDGNGELHPRGFGIACHFGVVGDIPTVGIGKNLHNVDGLDNEVVRQLMSGIHHAGEYAELVGRSGKVWGVAFRGSDNSARPVFVSLGHRMSLETAVEFVTPMFKYRQPEPIREADHRSRKFLREYQSGKVPAKVVRTFPYAIEKEILAAAREGFLSLLQWCIARGVSPSYADEESGSSALHLAAASGHAACVSALVDAGANVAALNKRNESALHSLAEGGSSSLDVLEILLRAGINPSLVSKRGVTALEVYGRDSENPFAVRLAEVTVFADE